MNLCLRYDMPVGRPMRAVQGFMYCRHVFRAQLCPNTGRQAQAQIKAKSKHGRDHANGFQVLGKAKTGPVDIRRKAAKAQIRSSRTNEVGDYEIKVKTGEAGSRSVYCNCSPYIPLLLHTG